MKTLCLSIAAGLVLTAVTASAAKEPDTSYLPPAVRQTISQWKGEGDLKKVLTHREGNRVYYEAQYKERGDEKILFIAEDGAVIRSVDERAKGSEKSKGKGKGWGLFKKNKDRGADETVQEPVQPVTTPGATTPTAPVPAPAPPQPQTLPNQPPPAPTTPALPPVAQAPIPQPRTQADIRAELNRRINIVNTLDDRPNAQTAGMAAIARETGVPVKTLEAQRKNHPVGTAGLLIGNELAKATGKPAGSFMEQRLKKRDWDAIATANKVDISTMFPKLDRVEEAMGSAIGVRRPSRPVQPVKTQAQTKSELDRRITILNTLDDRPNGRRAGIAAIARETGVPVKTLETQQSKYPVGSAGLLIGNEIAKASGKPAATILAQRLKKRDWDDIAADNKVDIATILPKLDRVEQAMANAIR
jgi:hypothetical protein